MSFEDDFAAEKRPKGYETCLVSKRLNEIASADRPWAEAWLVAFNSRDRDTYPGTALGRTLSTKLDELGLAPFGTTRDTVNRCRRGDCQTDHSALKAV